MGMGLTRVLAPKYTHQWQKDPYNSPCQYVHLLEEIYQTLRVHCVRILHVFERKEIHCVQKLT